MDIQETKRTLAMAVRMLENIQLLDMNGHLSYRIPGTDRILINSRKASRASLTVEDVVIADLEGNLIEGNAEPPSEVPIHTAIYRKRSDVFSVVHNHPHYQIVLGIANRPLQPVFSIGSFVDETLPVYEKSSLVNTREMGEELAECLGQAQSVTIRNHGTVAVEQDIESVFARSVFLEEAAKKQFYASLLGPMMVMEGDNLERTRETNWSPKIVRKIWDYHKEKAARDGILANI